MAFKITKDVNTGAFVMVEISAEQALVEVSGPSNEYCIFIAKQSDFEFKPEDFGPQPQLPQ